MEKSIHDYIRELRIEQRLSIQSLAKLSGVSASHISRIEQKKRNPSYDVLEKLAPHLQIELEKLLEVADILTKTNKYMDLNLLLSSKFLLYKGIVISNETKEKIRELLELNKPQD